MLYIEGFTLKFLINELNEQLTKRKVSRVIQYNKLSLSLFFGKLNLFFSINSKLPICYITEDKIEAPESPLKFALSLKKFLTGSILQNIEQIGYDRIIVFNFYKLNELGENKKYKLILELMGKHSNILLVDSNDKIIDLLKKFSLEENRLRLLMPHAPYEIPIIQKKISPFDIDENKFNEILSIDNSLNNKIEGFGKISLKEIRSFSDFKNLINRKSSPIIYKDSENIKLASFIEYQNFSHFENIKFESVNELINYYIKSTISSEHVQNLKKLILKNVQNKIKKNKNIYKNLKKDILKNENFEKYKKIGDILAANLYSIKNNKEKVSLFDFYENKNIEIYLDPKLSPQQNLDKYYQKFNKFKRGYEFNLERREFITNEIKYLESLLNYIENANTVSSLKNIEEELIEGKYITKKKEKKRKLKRKKGIDIEKIVIDNYEIFYGKNNKENEYITFTLAERNDIWLHIKDIPGSHVIIKVKQNQEIPDNVLEEAANLAVKFSKIMTNSTVKIDYTRKKYVKKPPKSKPGFVIYSHEKSILIKT